MNPVFVDKKENYIRDYNPMSGYVQLATYFISKMTGDNEHQVGEWLKEQISKNNPKVIESIPRIAFLQREEPLSDRQTTVTTLDKYIGNILKTKRIVAGTGTVYKSTREQKSLFTPYIDEANAMRSVYKKRMHEAKRLQDKQTADFNNELQNQKKIDINTLSGATSQPSTSIYTASTHPSLTSTGRLATSFANAIAEQLIQNNRHYDSPQVTLDSVVLYAYKTSHEQVRQCIEQFDLHVPTVDEVLQTIKQSSSLYWRNKEFDIRLREFVQRCSDEERCNIVYYGTLWGLITYNEKLARDMIDTMSCASTKTLPKEQAKQIIDASDEELQTLAIFLCYKDTAGKNLKEMYENDDPTYGQVADTIVMFNNAVEKYKPILSTFLKIRFLPSNIFNIESLYRKVVVTSDTDSTNFTCQEITKFITGKYATEDKDKKVTFLVTYLLSVMVMQALGIMSTNMGIDLDNVRRIAMKNEFYIPIHCITPSAKNYIMVNGGQEGNVFIEPEIVVKGVELRSSKYPKIVIDKFKQYRELIFLKLFRGEKVTTDDVFKIPAQLEYDMLNTIKNGGLDRLTVINVKEPTAYSLGNDAPPVKYHLAYNEIFGPKYGYQREIPYVAYTVKTNLTTKTKVDKWVNSLEDKELAKRVQLYLKNNDKPSMTTFIMPVPLFSGTKIPDEILSVVDIEPLVVGVMAPFYLLFESFGIYLKNRHNSKMISHVFSDYVDK